MLTKTRSLKQSCLLKSLWYQDLRFCFILKTIYCLCRWQLKLGVEYIFQNRYSKFYWDILRWHFCLQWHENDVEWIWSGSNIVWWQSLSHLESWVSIGQGNYRTIAQNNCHISHQYWGWSKSRGGPESILKMLKPLFRANAAEFIFICVKQVGW